jgi:apolipoprotein D and lipocalin family protein
MVFRSVLFPLVCLMALPLARAEPPLELVEELDLERYQGRWFEIARLPNRFQDDCASDTQAQYSLREDGRVDVVNRCRSEDGSWDQASGIARKADSDGPNSALEVRFAPRWLSWLPFVWGDYRVIALGEGYEYAMVGTEDRDYLWILARETSLEPEVLNRLINQARDQGFDTAALLMQPHGQD